MLCDRYEGKVPATGLLDSDAFGQAKDVQRIMVQHMNSEVGQYRGRKAAAASWQASLYQRLLLCLRRPAGEMLAAFCHVGSDYMWIRLCIQIAPMSASTGWSLLWRPPTACYAVPLPLTKRHRRHRAVLRCFGLGTEG